ncbi:MAG: discoidin domain-containing protein [Opitutae bacterium]|nr:discoidin domain-containing protein [Opitutae bacterium]
MFRIAQKSSLLRAASLAALALFLSFGGRALAAAYYVDPAGDDSRDGVSQQTAWKTLAKVGRSTFAPGDEILFKAGGTWTGQLSARGNGQSGAPIKLGRFGAGAKPIIAGGGQVDGSIKLLNQEYWEISGFEVTNRGSNQNQYVGIKVRNNTGRPLHHIRIRDCVVHDINGYPSGFYGANAGIAVIADMNNSTWNDLLIENNQVYGVDRVGIFVGPTWQIGTSADWMLEPKSQNITIQHNAVWDLGGDGIINFVTSHVVIQYNVVHSSGRRGFDEAVGPKKNPTGYLGGASAGIWNVISDHTTMQFNEVYGFLNPHDGQGFDIDMGTNHTRVQYNYSHDNDGGFLLIGESAGPAKSNDAQVRFNVSQNDGACKGIVHFGGNGAISGPDKLLFHNNTIFVPAWAKPNLRIFQEYRPKNVVGAAAIFNNIFYCVGSVSYPASFADMVFDHNTFFGHHPASEPADAHKLTSDPLLVAPGSAVLGRESVSGYQLQSGSPAIGSGRNPGSELLGARDYWGNPVSATAAPNRGAYNGPGIADVPQNWAFNATVTSSSAHENNEWSRSRLVDGQRTSFYFTSGFSSVLGQTADHPEWVALDFGAQRSVGKVILHPVTLPGRVGRGFPRDFQIQVWDGSAWQTRVTRTGYTVTDAQPQVFAFETPATTDKIRISCTALDQVASDYVLQLAEVEVTP